MKSLIYVGMDVHKESYSLCTYLISSGEFIGETKMDAKPSLIKQYLNEMEKLLEDKGYEEIEFITCYEAGCLGFSLYKEMVKLGINCKIVAPTTLHKSADSNVKKNDRRDAKMLARNLAYGTCSFVHIPDEIDQETREYIRMRMAHKREIKRIKNMINSFCLRNGHKYEGNYWTDKHISWLKHLELNDFLKSILVEYVDTYDILMTKLDRIEGKIEEISLSERYKESVDKVSCLKGLTRQGALTIISEIGDFSRFNTTNELCSYLGLVPGEHSSDGKGPSLGITKLGNTVVRSQLVESAKSITLGIKWIKSKRLKQRQKGMPLDIISYADKASKRLFDKYHSLISRGVHCNKAVIAIARELACFVWGMMTNNISGRKVGTAN